MCSIEKIYQIFLKSTGVSTDSRNIKEGNLFFAIKGENFDGNNYALQALEKGAIAVVVSNKIIQKQAEEKAIFVPHVLTCLQELANYHRRQLEPKKFSINGQFPIIAVTGTNGKTTTKELLREVLGTKYKVYATKGNLNNDIGVPLSLLQITNEHDMAIIEMGANHREEIADLAKIAEPNYGLITNIGKAHLEGFGSLEGVKYAKGRLFEYLNRHKGKIFLNNEDENLRSLMDDLALEEVLTYDLSRVNLLPTTPERMFLSLKIDESKNLESFATFYEREVVAVVDTNSTLWEKNKAGSYLIESQLVGSYNAINIMAAWTVGSYFGVEKKAMVEALQNYAPHNNRSQLEKTEKNYLIIDAYNANPSSMKVSLENFDLIQSDNKIICLGDMRELGEESVNEHINIVKQILSMGAMKIFLVGEEFRKALDFLKGELKDSQELNAISHFENSQALADFLAQENVKNSTILIKGSRGIMMEKILKML